MIGTKYSLVEVLYVMAKHEALNRQVLRQAEKPFQNAKVLEKIQTDYGYAKMFVSKKKKKMGDGVPLEAGELSLHCPEGEMKWPPEETTQEKGKSKEFPFLRFTHLV